MPTLHCLVIVPAVRVLLPIVLAGHVPVGDLGARCGAVAANAERMGASPSLVSLRADEDPPPGLSSCDWTSIRAAYEAGRRAVMAVDGALQARNPGQRWRTCFDGRGVLVKSDAGDWSWGLELASYGVAGHERRVGRPASVCAAGDRVVYDWDDTLTEWYVNEQRGLEHGYTIRRRPAGASNGANVVRLAIALRGELSAQVEDGGRDVRFVDASGAAVLLYSGLTVLDADGSTVSAWFEWADGQIALVVDDTGAAYPLTIDPLAQQAYLKASNTGAGDQFGYAVAVSGDTVVVGAYSEDSNTTGVNGDQGNDNASSSGAAYVFVRNGSTWSQQASLKASNTEANDLFGYSVAISGDTIVVGAFMEDSSATGVNGDQGDNGAMGSGAAYVFVRNGSTWSQQAYLKASNTGAGDWFGWSVAVSGDNMVVGAFREASSATGVNGDQGDDSAWSSGAAYVFVRSGTTWSQQAYLKASNTELHDEFGYSVAVSGDTVLVGASDEDSGATGVNHDQSNNSAQSSGAAYVFARSGTTWSQQAYLKASNTGASDFFGISVALSGDTIVIGAFMEDSSATGVNGNQGNNSALDSGAAYVFMRNGATWSQQAYLKASNTGASDQFGGAVAVSGDTAVVGAFGEDSAATGVDGNQGNNSAADSGAAYVFVRNGATWSQQAYLKASNTGASDHFGESVALSGGTVVAGARFEDSGATGVNGDQGTNNAGDSGAAYIFSSVEPCPSDADGDGICDDADNCPDVANSSQEDSDGDGAGDACDGCPDDPRKTSPGTCGCGIADTDSDGDGVPDCNDECPGFDDELDSDGDGIPDGCDALADLDNDGAVDGADLGLLLGQWGPCDRCAADLNDDGFVDGADLGLLLGAWKA